MTRRYRRQDLENIAIEYLRKYNKSYLKFPKAVPIEEIIEFHEGLEIEFVRLDTKLNKLGFLCFEHDGIVIYEPKVVEKDNDTLEARLERRLELIQNSKSSSNSEKSKKLSNLSHSNENIDYSNPIRIGYLSIVINADLLEPRLFTRYRFTLAHELSHFILHRDIMENNRDIIDKFVTKDENLYSKLSFGKTMTDMDWIEWQANTLAAYLLVPTSALKEAFVDVFKELRLHKGHIYVDHQRVNQMQYKRALSMLSQRFGVSKEVMDIRMKQCSLVRFEEKSDPIEVRRILKNEADRNEDFLKSICL